MVTSQNIDTFFDNLTLPQVSVNETILNNEEYPSNGVADDGGFFCYLDAAIPISPGEESGVVNFTARLLRLLNYNVVNRFIRRGKEIPIFVSGEQFLTTIDVSLVDRDRGIVLVMQEDRNHLERMDPESWLIAKAIAVFQHNNIRLKGLGLPPISKKVVPGITMCGTTPTFYKVPVTQDLVDAIGNSQRPEKVTIVHKLVPLVPNLAQDGMRPLQNRDIILRCFEALKDLI